MPWVIPPWLILVKFLGLTAKEYNEHDNDKSGNVGDDSNNGNGPQLAVRGSPPPPTTSGIDDYNRGDPGVPGVGILPRPMPGAVVATTCPDGLPPHAPRGEGQGGRSPRHAAANDTNGNGHISDDRADGVLEDNGDDNDLDNDDDDEGEDKNRDDDDNNRVVLGEAAAAAAPTTRMVAMMATSTTVMWTTMAAATTTTTLMTLTIFKGISRKTPILSHSH
jgi:hypothetical protein